MEAKKGFNGKLIRRCVLQERSGYSRSATYDHADPNSPRYDPSFPRPVKIGKSAIRFVESEVDAWIASKIQAREVLSKETIVHVPARVASLSTSSTQNDGRSGATLTIANHQSRRLKSLGRKD